MVLWRPLVAVGSKGNSQPYLLPPSPSPARGQRGTTLNKPDLKIFSFNLYLFSIYLFWNIGLDQRQRVFLTKDRKSKWQEGICSFMMLESSGWVRLLLGSVLSSLCELGADLSTCSHFLSASESKGYNRIDPRLWIPAFLLPTFPLQCVYSPLDTVFCNMQIIKPILCNF